MDGESAVTRRVSEQEPTFITEAISSLATSYLSVDTRACTAPVDACGTQGLLQGREGGTKGYGDS